MEKTLKIHLAEQRERIARDIEALRDGVEAKNELVAKHAPVTPEEIIWRAAAIARSFR